MTNEMTYELTSAPAKSDFYSHDCLICGHPELSKPIWVRASSGQVFPAGARCAAQAIYGDTAPRRQTEVRRAADAAQYEADRAEALRSDLVESGAQAVAAFAAGDFADSALRRHQQNFHAVKPQGMDFPTYLEHIASTGSITI